MFERLRQIDWKFWSSIFLNIVLVLYAGYFNLYEPKISLIIDVVQEIDVLDVREATPGLKVLHNGVDLFDKDINLKSFVIKVSNVGDRDVDPSQFDPVDLFGISISDGKVIEARVEQVGSEYLKTKVKPTYKNEQTIVFSPFYFKQHDFFTLKFHVLHSRSQNPTISAVGLIPAADRILVKRSFEENEKRSFWSEVKSGRFSVHLGRAVLYLLSFSGVAIAFVFCVVLPVDMLLGRIRRRSRSKLVERFYRVVGPANSASKVYIENFINDGSDEILKIYALLDHPKLIIKMAERAGNEEVEHSVVRAGIVLNLDTDSGPFSDFRLALLAKQLISAGLIQNGTFNLEFSRTISDLVDFLVKNEFWSNDDMNRARRHVKVNVRKIIRKERKESSIGGIDEDIISSVKDLLPSQPWPKGIDKEIRTQLNISNTMFNRIIDELIRRGDFKRQIDGKLYDQDPGRYYKV